MTIGAPHSWHFSSDGRSGTLFLASGRLKRHSGYLAHAMYGPKRPLFTTSGPPQFGHFSLGSPDRSCTSWISRSMSTAASACENGPQKSSSTRRQARSPSSTLSSSVSIWAVNPTSNTSRSEEHTSELQSQSNLVCRLLLEKKKRHGQIHYRVPPKRHIAPNSGENALRRHTVTFL